MSTSYITPAERLQLYSQQWETLKHQIMAEFRVAVPGIVEAVDLVNQTVDVTVALNVNTVLGAEITPTTIKTLSKIPIMIPRTSRFMITFPIAVGDECLLVVADSCIGSWWQNGGTGNNPEFPERHDLTNSFALFGPSSQPNKIPNYGSSSLQIRNADGTVFIEVTDTGINIFDPSGPVTINGGTVVIGSATTIDGRLFLAHQHTGVATGGGTSGPVL